MKEKLIENIRKNYTKTMEDANIQSYSDNSWSQNYHFSD